MLICPATPVPTPSYSTAHLDTCCMQIALELRNIGILVSNSKLQLVHNNGINKFIFHIWNYNIPEIITWKERVKSHYCKSDNVI